jgi:hypothetical protein
LQEITAKFLVKVVKVKDVKIVDTRFGKREVQGVFVKDVDNNKTTLSLWSPFGRGILDGHVYIFTNMRTENYPHNKPHFLQTTRDTTVDEAPEQLANLFANINLVDGTVTGIVVGFQNTFSYESCLNCRSRIKKDKIKKEDGTMAEEEPSHCFRCKTEITSRFADFLFVIVIMENDQFRYFTGFKRALNTQDIVNVETDKLEYELTEKYEGKQATIKYVFRMTESGKDCVIETIEFC